MKQNIYFRNRVYIDCELPMPPIEGAFQEFPNEHSKAWIDFDKHLSTLTSYSYTGTNLKDGQVVVENRDYELQRQYHVLKEADWIDCDEKWYNLMNGVRSQVETRIVAIPKEQPLQDKKEETQDMQEYWLTEIYNNAHAHTIERFIQLGRENYTIQRKQ